MGTRRDDRLQNLTLSFSIIRRIPAHGLGHQHPYQLLLLSHICLFFFFCFFFIQLLSHFLAYTKILFKVIYYYYYYYFLGRGPIHIYKLDISNQSLKYITCKRQNIHDNIEVDQRLSNANLQVNSTNREILAPPMENEGSSLHMISAYANVCQRQLQLLRELCSNMSLL